MNLTKGLAFLACALPLGAAAQVVYSQAPVWIEPAAPVARLEHLRVCSERNEALWDRKALIDQDRRILDSEGDAVERARAELDQALASLDRTDTEAVAAYNARSNELNAWVDARNRRVAELNGAAALLNANSRTLVEYCENLYPAR